MSTAGFYRLGPDGLLGYAPNRLATPSGVYLVSDAEQYQQPIDGQWRFFASEEEAMRHYLPPPSDVPEKVTMAQARRALLAVGLLDATAQAVSASGNTDLQIVWEYATEIRRNSPFVAAVAQAINLSPEQVDELFIAAAQID